jgi:hypothetical protein
VVTFFEILLFLVTRVALKNDAEGKMMPTKEVEL